MDTGTQHGKAQNGCEPESDEKGIRQDSVRFPVMWKGTFDEQ